MGLTPPPQLKAALPAPPSGLPAGLTAPQIRLPSWLHLGARVRPEAAPLRGSPCRGLSATGPRPDHPLPAASYSSSRHRPRPGRRPARRLCWLGGALRHRSWGPGATPAQSRPPQMPARRMGTRATVSSRYTRCYFRLPRDCFQSLSSTPNVSLFNLQISDLILTCMQCRTVPK